LQESQLAKWDSIRIILFPSLLYLL